MATIVIGDVHGCLAEFRALIAALQPARADRIVMLGDLLDKGPDPVGVVAFAREIGAVTIQGNHEEKALRFLKGNPVKVAPSRAQQWLALPADDVAWLRAAPWHLDLGGGWLAVHGGLLPGKSLADHDPRVAMRLRDVAPSSKGGWRLSEDGGTPWTALYDGEHNVVVGHEVRSLEAPHVDHTATGREIWSVDTGCVHGGRLSAFVVDTREVVQVQAGQVYHARREE